MEKLTVSGLNRYVKLLLETTDVLSGIWVTGEILNFSVNRFSGHAYFSLKDEAASVRAVCFKSAAARLRFVPKDGMQVTVTGRVSLYERDGQYQLIVEDIVPEGIGAGNRYLEKLREKLEGEGLFSAQRKRPLSRFPKSIAVITAAGSAALADIVHVVSRRFPLTRLTVFPALVQGLQSEASLVEAICAVSRTGGFDTAIIARGGGSKEDLYTFNSEAVVRAAAALSVPFISAVGHETDFSLLDLAADVRAATPSAAAEIAVPDIAEWVNRVAGYRRAFAESADGFLEEYRFILTDAARRIARGMEIRMQAERERLFTVSSGMVSGMKVGRASRRIALRRMAERLHTLDPVLAFTRGYTYIEKCGEPVSGVRRLAKNDKIALRFSDGGAVCTVDAVMADRGTDGTEL